MRMSLSMTKKEKMMNFLYVRKNIYFPFILSICFNSSIVICFYLYGSYNDNWGIQELNL